LRRRPASPSSGRSRIGANAPPPPPEALVEPLEELVTTPPDEDDELLLEELEEVPEDELRIPLKMTVDSGRW